MIKKHAISGVKWNTTSTIFNTVLQIIKISILARFLESSDFGLMAVVTLVLGFMSIFQDMGIGVAILHKQNISKKQYASLYWFNFLFSILLFLTLIVSTPLIEDFFSEKELSQLLPIMAYGLLISALGNQFQTIAQKNFQFSFIAIVNMLSSFFGFILAIYLAFNDYGVYSLVYSALFQSVIYNGVFFIQGIRTYGLKLYFSFFEIISFVRIGMYQVGSQMINYFTKELDILIIGKFFGSDVLGAYSLAKQLVVRPAGIFGSIIVSVAIPIFAKLQDDVTKLQEQFLRVGRMLNTLNFLIYFTIIVFAKPIVLLLYGEKYIDIVTLVQILSIYMYLRSSGNFSSTLEVAMGRTDLGFKWNIVSTILLGSSILLGSLFNITVMTIMMTVMMSFFVVLYWKLVIKKLIDIPLMPYLYVLVPDFRSIHKLIDLMKKR